MPKGFSKGDRLESRKLRTGHKRTSMHSRKSYGQSNHCLQLRIVATVAVVLSLAVLVTAFAVSILDAAHANEVWSASERIITIVITGLFAVIGSGFFRH